MKSTNQTFFLAAILIACMTRNATAQSFSVDTNVQQDQAVFDYAFTFNYDQAGTDQQLTDSVWSWGFTVNQGTTLPTNITTPTGWFYDFDANSGAFEFFTQGANGLAA